MLTKTIRSVAPSAPEAPRRRLRHAPIALALAAAAIAGSPGSAAAAPATVPCSSAGSGAGGAHYNCGFYPAGGAPVQTADGRTVGTLHKGTNWVICQRTGGEARSGAYYNNNWAWTLSDQNTWGWVNAVYAQGGDNNGAFGGVPACGSAQGNAPGGTQTMGKPPNGDWRGPRRPNGDYRKVPCASDYLTQVSAEGTGRGFVVSIWPTWHARDGWVGPFPNDGPPRNLAPMWSDVVRCLNFSSNRNFGLTSRDVRSLKKQLACHAYYGVHPIFGGSDWQLEAYRRAIPWSMVYDIRWPLNTTCGWS